MSENETATAAALEVRDPRTGKSYAMPILPVGTEGDTAVRAMDLRQIKVERRRVRADELRPGVHEHGVVQERDHVHRRRQGDPALPRLPDRAARREGDVPRGRVAAAQRRAADAAASTTTWVHDITYHTYVHENIKTFLAGLPLRRAPDVDARAARVAALSSFYPKAKNIQDPAAAPHRDHPPAREAADDRRVLLPAREGAAVHLPRQRPRLRRELPLDGRAHVGAEVRGATRSS